jgi:Mg2+ and Co2+ transporter CorA
MLTITQLNKQESGQWHSDELDAVPEKIREDSVLWVDAENPSGTELALLKTRFELDSLDLEELNEEGRRSKIEEHGDRIFCFVSFPSKGHFVSDVKSSWVALFVDEKWILSVHLGHSDITCQIYGKISTHGYSALSILPSTDIMFYIFLDLITNEYFLVSDLFHEKLQNLGKEAGSYSGKGQDNLTPKLGQKLSSQETRCSGCGNS